MIETAAIAGAVIRVAEESLFTWAEPAAADAAPWPDGPWWTATVAFTGPIAGRVALALPDGLARDLLASFLGLEPGEPVADTALADFLGEFANMSCGAWLTGLARQEAFALQHPVVCAVDAPAAQPTAVVVVSDSPVLIHASLT